MSDSQSFGFAKLVPGFDFLQNLAKGAGGGLGQLPQMSNWVAPTLSVEELDKRIQELRAVHFWLEQNGKALAATIQALEVQKMTLSTLQGMNLSMNELAESLKLKPEKMAAGFAMPTAGASATTAGPAAAARKPAGGEKAGPARAGKTSKTAKKTAAEAAAQVDPMQWWGSLSQQFQEIAATALKDVAEAGAPAAARPAAKGGKPTGTRASQATAPGTAKAPASATRPRGAASPARRRASGG